MAGKLFRYRWQPTTSGGSATKTCSDWTAILYGSALLIQVIIKSTLTGTAFNFKITSPTGNDIYERKNNITKLNEHPNQVGMRGTYVLTLENVIPEVDTFECEFIFEEKKDG